MSIYAFRDIGYTRGVKVGRGTAKARLAYAQGYSPRGIECLATWDIAKVDEPSEESRLHEDLRQKFGQLSLPNATRPQNGEEWFDVDADEALSRINVMLGQRGDRGLDEFGTSDKLMSAPNYAGRLVLWVMEELQTGRLKVYQCSEWKSPLEARRTYSRNGFQPVAAYTYREPASLRRNQELDALRNQTLTAYGTPPNRKAFGWLLEGARLADVESAIAKSQTPSVYRLTNLSAAGRPAGVRIDYSKGLIPENELRESFESIWWQPRNG